MNNRLTLSLLFFPFLLSSAFAAETITGTVRNRTTNSPAAGDEVLLLGLGQGMQEEGRTRTDAQGAFSLSVASSDEQHVVRVLHQGVNYDQAVSSTAPLETNVYDSVPKIPGLSGEIGMAQVESDGKVLTITEMYAITNASKPPVTQSRPDNFEISLPENAALDSVEVRSGRGIWVKVAPEPLKGETGKYGINFPMRPGDTLFKFVYHLPYHGATTFHLKLPYPIARFGVMHPPSMSFKALRSGAFHSPGIANGLQVEAAARPVVADVPAFKISGVGAVPDHGTQARAAPPMPAASVPAVTTHPAQGNPLAVADQSKQDAWLTIVTTAIVVAAAMIVWWRRVSRRTGRPAPSGATQAHGHSLLDSLKEELFQLESDRVHGAITAEEYAMTKQALDAVIGRALARK